LDGFVSRVFGKSDLFSVDDKSLMEERARFEFRVNDISERQEELEARVQRLMVESAGKSPMVKTLNVEKIRAAQQEQKILLEQGQRYLKFYRTVNLISAIKKRRKDLEKSQIANKILELDTSTIETMLEKENIDKLIEEGKIDAVDKVLDRYFKPTVAESEPETDEILAAIEELEQMDPDLREEQAQKVSRSMSEKTVDETTKRRLALEE
jgi:hypothetical protein